MKNKCKYANGETPKVGDIFIGDQTLMGATKTPKVIETIYEDGTFDWHYVEAPDKSFYSDWSPNKYICWYNKIT